ncbi:hypothetical protein [Streptomyces sp. AK010]|uniref:YqeB family protein n=1 Tax=Streptomyces sp. AK010 TaxID=2723074 RepID=UPI0016204D24|nr:hypothetical protein [Streptomyces sp. AK010]MBB6421378.1 hypothetical protein [Streptomyces sp. AK010]
MTKEQPGKKSNGHTPETSGTVTVLGYPRSDMMVILLGMPLLGVALGLLLPVVARWAIELPKLPLRTVFKFLAAADEPWKVAAFMGGGLLLGIGFAFVALSESLKITLTDARMEIEREDRKTIDRADVAAVFMDGKSLVVLDHDSRQFVRGTHEAPVEKLAAAFRAHGYPWLDHDPYGDLFRAWAPDSRELSAEVNSLLKARQEARKRKSSSGVQELTHSLENLGYTVRDQGNEQFWRPLVRS